MAEIDDLRAKVTELEAKIEWWKEQHDFWVKMATGERTKQMRAAFEEAATMTRNQMLARAAEWEAREQSLDLGRTEEERARVERVRAETEATRIR
jgi:hypothetical protein